MSATPGPSAITSNVRLQAKAPETVELQVYQSPTVGGNRRTLVLCFDGTTSKYNKTVRVYSALAGTASRPLNRGTEYKCC